MAPVVSVCLRRMPCFGQVGIKNLDQQRMTQRDIAGMRRGTIATGAGAKATKYVHPSQKLDVVPGPHGRGFHEVLPSVTREPGTHENVQNVMHQKLGLVQRKPGLICQGPRQVGMAAMMILPA